MRGAKLLPDEPDHRKLSALTTVVDLVAAHELQIVRVGYRTNSPAATFFQSPPWLALCWLGVLSVCHRFLEERLLLPVMDATNADIIRQMSRPVKAMEVIRAAGLAASISVQATHNLGEVLYADSQHSVCMQIADLVSYLRHVKDCKREGVVLTRFKEEIVTIADKIDPRLIDEDIVTLRAGT